jgi:hypothetical protein
MTGRRPAAADNETPGSSEWLRLDAMLDEAGRESFPASDPPALMVDDGPRSRPRANEHGGSSGRPEVPPSARLPVVHVKEADRATENGEG